MTTSNINNNNNNEVKELIGASFANDTSESFLYTYYNAFDYDRDKVSVLYRPNSAIVWNGTPVEGSDNAHQLFMSLPMSQHEVQSWDAHPLQDVITNNVNIPPSIMINVTGLVAHGKTAVNDLTDGKSLGNKRILDDLLLPRTFSQTFILRNENENWFIICKFTINKEEKIRWLNSHNRKKNI